MRRRNLSAALLISAITIGTAIVVAALAQGTPPASTDLSPDHSAVAAASPPAPTSSPGPVASPDPATHSPPGTSIVPGNVDSTSIDLVATYDADVVLDFGDRRLRVDVTLTVANRSGAGIDRVELNTITGPLGDLRLGSVEVDGTAVDARVTGQTIVVPLGGVLPDAATARIRVRLRASIPATLGGSNWMFTRVGSILQADRWLPWVGLHRPFKRPNHGDPFFAALSPFVRVRITTDRRLVIAAPGRRVAAEGLTQTFEAENVRDFPIVASPDFKIRERRIGDWTLRAFVSGDFPTATILDNAARALGRMSELAGDYPYPTLTIAQTAGGYALEGPSMIWIPTGLTGSRLRWNVYHEIAHQWFYGIVGSDNALDPFADEGIGNHLSQVVSGIWRDTSCPKRRLDLSIYRYSETCYFGQIYLHGADLLERVRHAMKPGEYWRGVRAYMMEHWFAIGSTREFFATLQEHTTVDLEPILAPWFPSLY